MCAHTLTHDRIHICVQCDRIEDPLRISLKIKFYICTIRYCFYTSIQHRLGDAFYFYTFSTIREKKKNAYMYDICTLIVWPKFSVYSNYRQRQEEMLINELLSFYLLIGKSIKTVIVFCVFLSLCMMSAAEKNTIKHTLLVKVCTHLYINRL